MRVNGGKTYILKFVQGSESTKLAQEFCLFHAGEYGINESNLGECVGPVNSFIEEQVARYVATGQTGTYSSDITNTPSSPVENQQIENNNNDTKRKKIITQFSIGNTNLQYEYYENDDTYETAKQYCNKYYNTILKDLFIKNNLHSLINIENCPQIVNDQTKENINAIMSSITQ